MKHRTKPHDRKLQEAINYLKERHKYILTDKQFKPDPPDTKVDIIRKYGNSKPQ